MAHDFASRHSRSSTAQAELPRWSWFVVGFMFGLFAAFLFYLWKVVPADPSAAVTKPTIDILSEQQVIEKPVEEIDFTFFEIFPNTEVPIVEEYTTTGKKVVAENYTYVLQAGSFRNVEDADRLRGELTLMNMQAFIKRVEHDGTPWHRVLVGPLDSKLKLSRTRNRLAEASIESIALRISR